MLNNNQVIKLFIIALTTIFVISCSKTPIAKQNSFNNGVIDGFYAEKALGAYHDLFHETKSQNITADRVQYIVEELDTIAINVDLTDNKGFVLLRKTGNPLMIMSKGNLNEALEKVPAFKETYKHLMGRFRPPVPEPSDSSAAIVSTLLYETTTANILPIIDVDMHQGYPFNKYTPNGYAGCTPVAIAQSFSVFEDPDTIAVTFSGSSISSLALSWTNMKEHLHFHDSLCVYCDMNGYLLREIGNRCNASYNQGSTSAWPTMDCISSFGYTAINGQSYDESRITSSLRFGLPVIISGFNQAGTVGHSWNIDGYYELVSEYSVDTMQGNVLLEHNWNEIHDQVYMHFNYGWGGYANGYVLARETITDIYDDYEYVHHPVQIFSNDYNDVRRLVTHIAPI